MSSLSEEDRRLVGSLLTPSWLSGLLAVVAGLIISVGAIGAFEAHNSQLQQQLLAWQQSKPQAALTTPDQTLPQNDHPSLKSSWPLLLIWSLAGLAVYVVAAAIVHSFTRAEEFRESLEYVHARPRAALETTAEHLLLRLLAAIMLVGFTIAFWHQIVPYSITAAHASAADLLSLYGGLYALLSFALVVICWHVETVLLRLALGRARVFSGV